jgi:hypothetical protein
MDSLVKVKGTLASHITINAIKVKLIEFIQSIPNYVSLKHDHELIEYVLKELKNKIKDLTTDFTDIIIDIFTKAFGELPESDKDSIQQFVKYLEHNKLAKASTTIEKIKHSTISILKKK